MRRIFKLTLNTMWNDACMFLKVYTLSTKYYRIFSNPIRVSFCRFLKQKKSVRGSNPHLSFNRPLPTRQTDWIILDVTNALTDIRLMHRVWSGHLIASGTVMSYEWWRQVWWIINYKYYLICYIILQIINKIINYFIVLFLRHVQQLYHFYKIQLTTANLIRIWFF